MSARAYATLSDVIVLSGQKYTAEEQDRIAALIPLISDALRTEAVKVDRDLDEMIAKDQTGAYGNTVKLVTVDIVVRVMRQSFEGDPLTQESQAALGYSWSGTYTIAGGGIAASILKNDLKRLGLKKQRYGWVNIYGDETARDSGTT